jgi:C_GCAxxG_C_C family probable redox protein
MQSEVAGSLFQSGFNCAQSVFIPFARDFGLSEAAASRIASSFGAGMGKTQATCGAVTGGLMALGLEKGFESADDQAGRDRALRSTKEFMAGFKSHFGSLLCRELLGCDLNTEEGQRRHKEEKQRDLICMKCVQYAAASVESMRSEAARREGRD